MKPFGDAFIKLIKMIIAPIIFTTVVLGIAGAEDPGTGMNVDVRTLDSGSIAAYTGSGKMASTKDFLLGVIPATFFDAFAKSEILQVVLLAVLFGIALQLVGARENLVFRLIQQLSEVLFGIRKDS